MCHNPGMDTQVEQAEVSEADRYPFVKGIVPGTMSGAEVLAYWKENGVFDVPWPQHEGIGEGERFKDSTEYVQHLRRQADYRGRP
jgi:hypothetical protein